MITYLTSSDFPVEVRHISSGYFPLTRLTQVFISESRNPLPSISWFPGWKPGELNRQSFSFRVASRIPSGPINWKYLTTNYPTCKELFLKMETDIIIWSAGPDPISSTTSPVAPCSAPEGLLTSILLVSWSWFSILLESNDQLKILYHHHTRKSTTF